MEIVKPFSDYQYMIWYMEREYYKRGKLNKIPKDEKCLIYEFRLEHESGKGLSFFKPHCWDIVKLNQDEFKGLIFLDNGKDGWTQTTGMVVPGESRRLIEVAERADRKGYWDNPHPRHQEYYDQIVSGNFQFSDMNRIVIRNATSSEKACDNDARYYLHDGSGRGLSFITALLRNKIQFTPVEAIYADTQKVD